MRSCPSFDEAYPCSLRQSHYDYTTEQFSVSVNDIDRYALVTCRPSLFRVGPDASNVMHAPLRQLDNSPSQVAEPNDHHRSYQHGQKRARELPADWNRS